MLIKRLFHHTFRAHTQHLMHHHHHHHDNGCITPSLPPSVTFHYFPCTFFSHFSSSHPQPLFNTSVTTFPFPSLLRIPFPISSAASSSPPLHNSSLPPSIPPHHHSSQLPPPCPLIQVQGHDNKHTLLDLFIAI